MSSDSKPATPVDQIDSATWQKIGRWLADEIHDREIDADEIAAHEGPAFLPAMRGLAEYLMAGGPFPPLDVRLRVLATIADKRSDVLLRQDGTRTRHHAHDGYATARGGPSGAGRGRVRGRP